jgi:hypothetical protein
LVAAVLFDLGRERGEKRGSEREEWAVTVFMVHVLDAS